MTQPKTITDTLTNNEYIIVPKWRSPGANYVFIAERLPGNRNDGTIVRMIDPTTLREPTPTERTTR